MFSKNTFSSKLTIALLLIMAVFLGQLKFKQWRNQHKIEQEKQSLQQQADDLQRKNIELTQSLEYLNSPDFKERVARQQLALKKEGELVYSFSERIEVPTEAAKVANSKSNVERWRDYFFKRN